MHVSIEGAASEFYCPRYGTGQYNRTVNNNDTCVFLTARALIYFERQVV